MLDTHWSKTYYLLTDTDASGDAVDWPGGYGMWVVYGTWDGASAQLQLSPDNGTTWVDIDGALLTENGGWNGIVLPVGKIRVEITGAGTTSLSSNIKPVAGAL